MKVLLDEMMPRLFATLLVGHEVSHAVELGWRHVTNGKLLNLCEASGFTIFITKDANLPYQQNLMGRQVALIILKPITQDYLDLKALAPNILLILPTLKPGSVTVLS